MAKFQKARLLKLADLLEADAKNKKGIKFDLSDWGNASADGPAVSCGTTACAMGLAVASGAFKRAGLRPYGSYSSGTLCPEYKGRAGFEAASAFFSITINESYFLFSDDNYPRHAIKGVIGERFVAQRIRAFVKDRSIAA